MSGHSKWAKIHRAKGETDAKRGKVFQKLAKEIYVAAKAGDKDPATNPNLRMIIEKARSANMPKDNINKAIEKAKGSADSEEYDAIRYEGYGHGGVAFMVDCLTDNKNRTASLVRSAFTKRGGNLGTDGSVSYMFSRKGVIEVAKGYDEDALMLTALDAGALDFIIKDDSYLIYTEDDNFINVKEKIEEIGVNEFLTSEVTYVPTMEIELADEEAKEKIYNLVEQLEDLDDVNDVYYNLKDE